MHRHYPLVVVAGLGLFALAGGCQTIGGKDASADSSGPSPSFGLRAPRQTEPPLQEGEGHRLSRPDDSRDVADGDSQASKPRKRWLGQGDAPAQPRALPVSDRTDSTTDDGLDL